jgi:hypothetical protein
MATEIVRVQLEDGSKLAVELDEDIAPGIQAVGLGGDGVPEIDFGSAMRSVRAAAVEMAKTFHDLPVAPDEFEIAFGVKLGGSLGAIIAKATGEANFAVKLNWKKGG